MTPQKITRIRELTVGDGIGQRVSISMYDEDTGIPIRPEGLDPTAQATWDTVMSVLQNYNGCDFRHIIDGPALIDHCLNNCKCGLQAVAPNP